MAEDGKIVYKVIIDDTNAVNDAEQAGQKVGKAFDDSANSAGGTFENIMTGAARRVGEAFVDMAATATKAVGDFMKDSLGVGMNFDSAMSQVAATLGYSVEELSDSGSDAAKTMGTLRDFAQEMGETTVFTASQAAEALNYMALAGYDAETSMAMLPNVLNLAAAGGMELGRASDVVTDIQSALGLSIEETSDLVDQMAKTASRTNTSVSQLGEAMLQIGATATFMRGGSAELAQVLGLLADNGIKGAEGGTHLRNMLLSLAAPTDKAAEMIESLGVSIFDADGQMLSFQDIFAQFSAKMAGWSQEDMIGVFDVLFNKRDTAAALALMNTTSERWGEVGDAIDGAKGSAQKMADVQLDNLAGDITLLQSAFEGFQIAISDKLAPIIREVMPEIIELVGQLTEKVKNADWSGLSDKIVNVATKVYDFAVYLMENGETVAGTIEAIGAGFIGWKGITAVSNLTGQVSSLFGWVSKLGGFLGITGGAAAAGLGVAAVGVASLVDYAGDLKEIGYLGDGHELQEYADNVAYFQSVVDGLNAEDKTWWSDMDWNNLTNMQVALAHAQEELAAMSEGGGAKPADTFTETGTAAETAEAQVAAASTGMMESISGISDTISTDFSTGMDEMSTKAAEATENMNTTMATNMGVISANAAIWGEDMMISLSNGIITGNNQWLVPTLQAVAQTMTDYLGHSEPKLGPLAHDSEWMPDMMQNFIMGIDEYAPDLTEAIVSAFDLQPLISHGLGLSDIERDVSFNLSATGTAQGAQINVPLYVDGREIARATAWSMSEQLAWEEL